MNAFDPVSQVYLVGAMLVFMAQYLLPARAIQKRHSYTAWILVFGLIPYVGPLALLWAFATSQPRGHMEAHA